MLQWRPNADVELYAEGMATRFLLDAESDYFVGLPWWGTPVSATKIAGTNQLQTLTSKNVNTIMSTQANKNETKTHQFAVGGLWDINPEWRFTSEVASTKSSYTWRNPILDAITVVPNASINTNRNGTLHVDYTGIDLQDPSNYYLKGFFDRYGEDKGSSNDCARRPGVHAQCRRHLQGNQRRRARRQTRSRIDQELRGQCGSTGRVRRRVSVRPPERDVDSRLELPVGTDVQRRSRLWLEAVVHAVRQLPAQ